ncbi:MAG: serine hydrolase, partial [Bacteroidetes bacterium]|nr:serine hydrolase [Bacteroidota bacterium]
SVEEDPGKSYKYCNHCYALAGFIIEKVSKQSFQDYLVEHILKPLQIESAGPLVPTPSMVEELALPYNLNNKQPVPMYQQRFDVFPAGDIYLTCSEMASFLVAQLNDGRYKDQAILKPESVKEMQKEQFETDEYGLGIGIEQTDNEKFLTHSGGVPGFSSHFKLGTNSKTGVYIASNTHNVHQTLTAITNFSMKLLNGDKQPEPSPSFILNDDTEIELPDEVLRKYIGKYQLKADYFVSVTVEDLN